MKIAAGILQYKIQNNNLFVFLVSPGGPLYRRKLNKRYWGIPKGLVEEGEDLISAAKREFIEETGIKVETNKLIDLGTIIQLNNKKVYCWGYENNLADDYKIISNHFELEWPPKSGVIKSYPEIDKGEFFNSNKAKEIIIEQQLDFITRLENKLVI